MSVRGTNAAWIFCPACLIKVDGINLQHPHDQQEKLNLKFSANLHKVIEGCHSCIKVKDLFSITSIDLSSKNHSQ